MSVTRTLANLLQDIRDEGDLDGLTDRHPDAELIRFFNRSWAKLRTKIVGLGFALEITPSAEDQLPTSPPVTGEQYLEVDFPAGAIAVHGFDVFDRGRWWPLKPGTFGERRDYVTRATLNRSGPHTYVVTSVPQEDGVSTDPGKIQLYPLGAGGQTYKVWYTPAWVDVTDTTYVIYGHDIWFDWAINDVIIRTAKKDDDSQATYAIARDERDRCWEDIRRAVQNMNRAEPIRPVRRPRMR